MQSYSLPLKVGDTKGNRIVAKITKLSPNYSQIDIPAPKAVIKDKPEFLIKDKIRIQYEVKDHTKVVNTLTKYLEDIFLKELENENNNTSDASKFDSRRNKKPPKSEAKGSSKGTDSNTIRDSRRGDKPTESDRGRVKDSTVDKKGSGISKDSLKPKDKTISEP